MFGSGTLDVAIGVVMVYLTLSLVVTSINEGIATILRSRAKHLDRWIVQLLGGEESGWVAKFYSQPLVAALANGGKRPSYIPSNVFVTALLQLLRESAEASFIAPKPTPDKPGNAPADLHPDIVDHTGGLATFDQLEEVIRAANDQWLVKLLLPLLENARSDLTNGVTALQKFSHEIEGWFDQGMDRVGGWYKQKTQAVVALIAAVIVISINADTLVIARQMFRDGALRSSLVEAAKHVSAPPSGTVSQQSGDGKDVTPEQQMAAIKANYDAVAKNVAAVEGLGVPLGWGSWELASWNSIKGSATSAAWWKNQFTDLNWLKAFIMKVVGLGITIFAASLGAPFWFDVLNKFMSVRGAGKAPEERPKDPKKAPQPVMP